MMWRKMRQVAWTGCATILCLVPAEVWAQGCAMCKTAVGGPEDPLAKGINTSILFMMSMPFLLAGIVGGWFAYMYLGQRHGNSRPEGQFDPGREAAR